MGALAARQHGVVSRGQLLDAGVSDKAMERRLGSGHLVRLHRGVYAVGHAQLRREGRWLAGVLAVGSGAVLSHRAAAALHGIRESDGAVDVTTTRRASTRGVVVHRTTVLDDADVTTRSSIPVTTVARTLADLAAILSAQQLGKLLRETDRLGRLDAPALREALERASRHGAGHKALQAALAEHERLATSFTRSELEDRFLALLDAHELQRPLTNHPIHGMQVDAAWLRERLVVELDSWAFHADRGAFQEDRERDVRLARAGFTTVRFTYAHVTGRPAWVAETVRDLLARADRAPSPVRATMSDPCP
jgi:very-short-patch-repair endonuclease